MILRATNWRTNGQMIADMHELGYVCDEHVVLDPTYGRGKWWTVYRPPLLIAHDLHTLDGVSWTELPEADNSVDTATFDPPYVTAGGRKTSTQPDFQNRYGLDKAPTTLLGLHELIVEGIVEIKRVLKPRGLMLLKAMNYVSGGRYRSAAYELKDEAENLGFRLIDEFVHLGKPGPQPKNRRCVDGVKVPSPQVHGRSNYSLLFVMQAPK
jgi:tRNA G10  N-methylase Trm11